MGSIIAIIIGFIIGAIINFLSKRMPWISLITGILLLYFAFNYFVLAIITNHWLLEIFIIVGGIAFVSQYFSIRNKYKRLRTNIINLLNKKKENKLSLQDKNYLMSISNINDEKEFDLFINILMKKGDIPFIKFEKDNNFESKEIVYNSNLFNYNVTHDKNKEDNLSFSNNKEDYDSHEIIKENKLELKAVSKSSWKKKFLFASFVVFLGGLIIFLYKKDDIANYFFNKSVNYYNNKDFVSYLEYLKFACTLDNAEACNLLGVVYNKGLLVHKDVNKAIKLFEKSCKRNNSKACVHLGMIYTFNKDFLNYKKAYEAYKKACDLSNPLGCFNLGIYYANGNKVGIKNDYKKAYYYLKEACKLGLQKGCEKAEYIKLNLLNTTN